MLTRLQVSGFKNLQDVDILFGPFSCIAGVNGVGKSNLFDAIHFLSLMANHSLLEAAAYIRDDSGRSDYVRNLFTSTQGGHGSQIKFEAEMIISPSALDDLNQRAKATSTFVRYVLHLRWEDAPSDGLGPLRIEKEELHHILARDVKPHLSFPHSKGNWRDQVIKKGRRSVPYISSTQDTDGRIIINRHQDGGSKGKPQPIHADTLPRTVLSRANADEAPTALCVRREMESWRVLQLEPSSLRQPDALNASPLLTSNGGHLPAVIYRLQESVEGEQLKAALMQSIANRLRELVPDVRGIRVEKNEKLERLTLYVTLKDGVEHAARSLSDGTLRFLALVVLEADPLFEGVVCFEEPENGIHPERIHSIIRLLRDIATDPEYESGPDNPLRQVIINTHAPSVVRQIPDDSLLIARPITFRKNGRVETQVRFGYLSDTWRAKRDEAAAVSIGMIHSYLNPDLPAQEEHLDEGIRVSDRPDAQELLPLFVGYE